MLKPKPLQQGDRVGVIAPASPPDMRDLSKGVHFLEQLGFHVQFGKQIEEKYGYLAGSDEARLADFHEMLKNPHIKAIFFARGGYGTARFIDQVDFDLLRKHPKVIWGYSDITYLLHAIYKQSNLITFHGPMIASDIVDQNIDKRSKQMFQQLFTPMSIFYTEHISKLTTLVPGVATGTVIGGNLTLLISTLGTPYEIDTTGKILFLEDVGEQPYQIDRMLNQLRLAGKLNQAAGIVVGSFTDTETKEPSLTLQQVFARYLGCLSCPVMTGFAIGHSHLHIAIPIGVEGRMDTTKKTFIVQSGIEMNH